jgi:sulfite exporter TauE/SafE
VNLTIDQAIGAGVLGLIGSTHCVGMCGPLVLALAVSGEQKRRWLPSAAWQVTRALGYAVLGGLFGALASTVNGLSSSRALSLSAIFGGLVMLLVGLRSLWLAQGPARSSQESDRWGRWVESFSRGFRSMLERGGLGIGAGLGVATAFFPCGLLYAAYGQAAASGDPLSGALIMAIFALSSAPALILVSVVARLLGGGVGRRRSLQVVGAMVLLSMGSYTVTRACIRARTPMSSCCDSQVKGT